MNLNVLQRSANTPACPFNSAIAMNNHAAAHRAQRLRSALDNAHTASVTDAIYIAGYQSTSRFYEQSAQVLGMTPSRYRAGGAAHDIRLPLASVRWAPFWSPRATGAYAPSCWTTKPTPWRATCRTGLRTPT